MNLRLLAPIVLCAGLAWGCSSPDLSAAEAPAAGTPAADATTTDSTSTPVSTASAPLAAASVSRNPSSTSTATPTTATPSQTATTNPLLSRTVKILALGDSMTVGHEDSPTMFRSYRGRLFQLLVSAGYAVDFVGTQRMAPAIGGDPDHDGYGGAWIGPGGSGWNLTDMLPRIMPAVDPDIIILALGWNSVYNEPYEAANKYRDFVARVAAAKPNAHIIVATLSPQQGQTEAQSGADLPGYNPLNTMARNLARASATDRIHLADYAAAGFQFGDYHDVIHWTQAGGDRAANVIFQTLVNGPLKR